MSWRFTGAATPAIASPSGVVQVVSSGRGFVSPAIAGPWNSPAGSGTLRSYPSISQRPRMIPRAGKSSQVVRRRISTSCR